VPDSGLGSLSPRIARGLLFTTDNASLAALTAELNAGARAHFPQFFDGSAASLLAFYPAEGSGRGVPLPDGVFLQRETVVALYFGTVRSWVPPGDHVLALPPFRRNHVRYDLSLDAGPFCCRANPDPINMVLFNHSCLDATVMFRRLSAGCRRPSHPLWWHLPPVELRLWHFQGRVHQ
jgi:hypothetical protein